MTKFWSLCDLVGGADKGIEFGTPAAVDLANTSSNCRLGKPEQHNK